MTIIESVGWVLVHFIWQGTAIALALAALLAVIPTARASVRYVLSCGALALMLAATLATAAGIAMQPPAIQPISDARGSISSSSSVIVHRPSPEAAGSALSAGASTTAATATWSERLSARLRPVVERSMPWLVLLWIVGVSMLSIRLAGGWWRTRALRVAGVSAAPASAQQQLDELCTRLRINRAVALVASVRVAVPVVIGHLKPVVVLPAAALAGLSPSHLEAVLAHELAHVRRHDYLVNLAQTVIETLLFYHPAVWWVSQQVRVAREHCCDDLAVSVCGSRRNYIHALLDLEQLRGSRETFALGATDGSLLGRARRLLRHTEPRSDAPRLAASAIVLTVASVVAAVSFAPLQSVDAAPAAAATEAAATSAPEEEATPSAAASAQSGPATPVIASPDTAGTLASRWAWAERAARDARRTRYWIGYTTSPVKGLPRFVYFDRTSRLLGEHMVFTGHTLSDEVTGLKFPGRPLALPGDSSGVKVLYAFDVERGTPVLTTVHVSTVSLPVDLKNHPVFWLGSADGSQGLERVDQLYAKARTIELKDDLIATAGVHDASQAVVAWLSARVASGDADSLRADAAERIAWHPIPESIAALDRIARNDQTSQVRQEAAEALGDLALPDAAPVLIALARSLPDQAARLEAVEALGARQEPIARDALESIARQDASADVQREAVETLGDYKDRRGVPLLTELARTHANIDVRREAIETLGDVMPRETLVPLLRQLASGDADPRIQEEVVDTLAGLEHPEGLAVLRELAQTHASHAVRREAVEALGHRASAHDDRANDPERASILDLLATIAANDDQIEVRVEAVETLGEIADPKAVERLRELARTHPEERVRAEAVETLGETQAAASTVSLLKSIALDDRSTTVQLEAIETLGDLPDGAGIDALVDLARDHPMANMRKEALEVLVDSDHPKARAVLDRALRRPPGR